MYCAPTNIFVLVNNNDESTKQPTRSPLLVKAFIVAVWDGCPQCV
eukprot:CAMPEP_0118709208 /NCGR_PEP_ID=MMETSP0800-20121206/22469_1 /TAXON_ID=210618 ORGANISM="Striatella unipunctata, Strain CCMP2910" /NCGR_SAMPLE_ID=MMETSP0800 /ASSEMBLY_ACC=CAM_ASM_000638 /LENGTH=44 /DNA_ID= /DNA_START= /DNA_END= /DNA_ORIENTATION=